MVIKKYILVCFIFSLCYSQNWIQNQRTEKQFKEAVSNYNSGRYATSVIILNKIIDSGFESFHEQALLLLLKSQVALNKSEEAKKTAKIFFSDYPSSPFLEYAMDSIGDLFVNNANYESAYRMFVRSKELSNVSERKVEIDKKLLRLIKISLSTKFIDELLIMETNLSSVSIHYLAIAYSQIVNGTPDTAALTLAKIDPSHLPDTFSDLFELLLRESYKPASPVMMVGLALPLSGSGSATGKAFLDGFRSALTSNDYNDKRISILARDTRSDEIETIKIISELESIEQIVAIATPVDQVLSLSLLSSLKNSDLPVILTNKQNGDLSLINDKTFFLNSDYFTEGVIAAQYIVKHLGLDSIAIVAPANKNTEIQVDAFTNEVDRLGGKIVATEWYSGVPKNLNRQFSFLRQVGFRLEKEEDKYDEALGMAIDSLDALFDVSVDDFFDIPELKIEKMSSSDSSKIILSTIQAIYLPINFDDLEFIGPQIPMYNFDTKIIGNSSWKQLEILTKENIGPHLRGMSIISSTFSSNSDSARIDPLKFTDFQSGYNASKLLTSINLSEISRVELTKSLRGIIFNDSGYSFIPSKVNKNINSAFQLIGFNGKAFIKEGVVSIDTLSFVNVVNP
tara:strand:+ start:17307 stop:19178 length:1872 start_codon:yes stop_codon:yes gene_type:complete